MKIYYGKSRENWKHCNGCFRTDTELSGTWDGICPYAPDRCRCDADFEFVFDNDNNSEK